MWVECFDLCCKTLGEQPHRVGPMLHCDKHSPTPVPIPYRSGAMRGFVSNRSLPSPIRCEDALQAVARLATDGLPEDSPDVGTTLLASSTNRFLALWDIGLRFGHARSRWQQMEDSGKPTTSGWRSRCTFIHRLGEPPTPEPLLGTLCARVRAFGTGPGPSPLFTRVRGRGLLRRSHARSCVVRVLQQQVKALTRMHSWTKLPAVMC
jgi:hypothetical protein